MYKRTHRHWDVLVPLGFLAGASLLFRISNLDVAIESLFFQAGRGWPYGDQQPWRWLYEHGPIPALVVAYGAFGIFLLSFLFGRLRSYRIAAIFLVLVMIIGPGLIVNTVFKQHWGRPRPLDLVQFSGDKEFLTVLTKGAADGGQSFPSGHASMGFYWLTPFFIFRKNYRMWARFFLFLGLGYGMLMGVARMVQGSHFPSDILWSFGFVYFTGMIVSRIMRPDVPRRA